MTGRDYDGAEENPSRNASGAARLVGASGAQARSGSGSSADASRLALRGRAARVMTNVRSAWHAWRLRADASCLALRTRGRADGVMTQACEARVARGDYVAAPHLLIVSAFWLTTETLSLTHAHTELAHAPVHEEQAPRRRKAVPVSGSWPHAVVGGAAVGGELRPGHGVGVEGVQVVEQASDVHQPWPGGWVGRVGGAASP
jgi:hypothetical protein